MNQISGKLIIVSAPSGAGKTTIVRNLLNKNLNLEFSISACSRAKRKNEKDGIDYYFLSIEEFKNKIENQEFVEWEEVYDNYFYGTLKSEIERIWKAGKHVIFDVDVQGGLKLKEIFKEKALSLFVKPPSVKELEKRLIMRSTEEKEKIRKRVEKAAYELSFANQFDLIIVNDVLDDALRQTENVVRSFLTEE